MGISIRIIPDTSDIDLKAEAAQGIDADIAEMVAKDIAQGERSRAAVDTGQMRDSIYYATAGGSFFVDAAAEHSGFVNYGTSKMAAQPFVEPAVEAADIDGACQQALKNAGF